MNSRSLKPKQSRYFELLEDLKLKQTTFLDLFKTYKQIRIFLSDNQVPGDLPDLKIALIGSYTLDPLTVCLEVLARAAGFNPVIFQGDYNLYLRELLDSSSPLYRFAPELVILSLDTEACFRDILYYLESPAESGKEGETTGIARDLISAIDLFLSRSGNCTLVLNNFPLPCYSPFGILKTKTRNEISFLIQGVNESLREHFLGEPRVFLFDLENFLSAYGKNQAADPRLKYIAKIPFSHDFFPILASRYIVYLQALFGAPKKVLVLDLDNTLWGGIVGEAGLEGIALGEGPAGEAFVDFQKRILELHNRGVILAINSKNNFDDGIKVFREHPRMVLKEEMFAAIEINWRDKAANMNEISRKLNLGLESFVFFDDSPVERGYIAETLPQVAVPPLPDDPLLYPDFIARITCFDQAALTEEDRGKARLYRQKRQAEELRAESDSLESYLRKLRMTAKVKETDAFSLPRVHQLFGKTNQFNLTTKRYSLPELRKFIDDPEYRLWDLELSDRFGNNGIVAAALVRFNRGGTALIDSFLMSCRVIGRFVEDYFLSAIADAARETGVKRLVGIYSSTEKNAPAREFYMRLGFRPATPKGNIFRFEACLEKNPLPAPEWIKPAEQEGER